VTRRDRVAWSGQLFEVNLVRRDSSAMESQEVAVGIVSRRDEPRVGLVGRYRARREQERDPLIGCGARGRGVPEHITSETGSEFTATVVLMWLEKVGGTTLCITPGSLRENGYMVSLNGTGVYSPRWACRFRVQLNRAVTPPRRKAREGYDGGTHDAVAINHLPDRGLAAGRRAA